MEKKTKQYEHLLKLIKIWDSEIKVDWINKDTWAIFQCSTKKEKIIVNIYLLLVEHLVHEFTHAKNPKLGGNVRDEKIVRDKARNFVERMKVNEIKEIAEYLIEKYLKDKKAN